MKDEGERREWNGVSRLIDGERCDAVAVRGKETRGKSAAAAVDSDQHRCSKVSDGQRWCRQKTKRQEVVTL